MTHRTQPWQRFQDRAPGGSCPSDSTRRSDVRKVTMPGSVEHSFDLVSPRGATVGDAKYLSNIKVPAAKHSDIAEYVWLLQNTGAKTRFMVFGENRTLAQRWLNRYAARAL